MLGLVTEWSTLVIEARWKTAVGFVVLILVLFIRPQGIFGKARRYDRLPARRLTLTRSPTIGFWTSVGIIAGTYAIFTLGLQLNVGYTGIVNFGQAGFMAIGAYAMGVLVTEAQDPSGSRCRSRS